jgi:hypothetical protein
MALGRKSHDVARTRDKLFWIEEEVGEDMSLAADHFFFGMYKSVSVPSNASADMPIVSESVGCG